MITIVCRYTNEVAFLNRLRSLGLVTNEGKRGRTEPPYIEICNSKVLEDVDGNKYVAFKCLPSQASKLPPNNNPAFSIIWRSDDVTYDTGQLDEEGNPIYSQHPWPMVTVSYPELDEDGVPTGVTLERQQGVGKIQ